MTDIVAPRLRPSPTRIVDSLAGRWPARVAAVDGDTRWLFPEFVDRVHRLVGALAKLGVEPGDRVAYLGVNSAPLLEMYHAVPRLGAILVPINIRLSAADIDFILDDCEPKLAICDAELAPLIEESASRRGIHLVLRGREDEYEAMLAQAEPITKVHHVGELDVCEIFYTSGTTGRPNGVELTHRGVYLHALAVWTGFDYKRGDIQLHTIPLFHVNGWGTPHTLTLAGGTHVMLPRFDPERVIELVQREQVTIVFLVPTMLVALLEHLKGHPARLPSLRQVIAGVRLCPSLCAGAPSTNSGPLSGSATG
jgi:fatty-acyl-CoA synthase